MAAANRRFGGGARELRLQSNFQRGNQRLAFGLAHRLTLRGAPAADLRFDLAQLGDPPQRFLGDRRRSGLGNLVEPSAPVGPAKGPGHGIAGAATAGDLFVSGIAVALHDAAVAGEQGGACAAPRPGA
jgi:hypothetical protein